MVGWLVEQLSQVLSSPLATKRPSAGDYTTAQGTKSSPPKTMPASTPQDRDALSTLLGDDTELLWVLRDLKKAVSLQPRLRFDLRRILVKPVCTSTTTTHATCTGWHFTHFVCTCPTCFVHKGLKCTSHFSCFSLAPARQVFRSGCDFFLS